MIRRLYIHNFRCLENFELSLSGYSSVLLIGKNGSGKTTVSLALEIFQKIARGTNRIKDIVKPKDRTHGREGLPMRFEIEVELNAEVYEYTIAFELPENFREFRILDEKLSVNGQPIYSREVATVHLGKNGQGKESEFQLDWHLVALPLVQEKSTTDPLYVFKNWLASMLILRPIPSQISGGSDYETLQPTPSGSDFAAWFTGLLAHEPSAYTEISHYLKQVIPDLKDIKNPLAGTDARNLLVQFSLDQQSLNLPFEELSDGEKSFMLCALVIAAQKVSNRLFCLWDEPDNYLALDEVGHFVLTLRKAFSTGKGQFIATSHNPEAIRRFSDENTLVLYRKNHFEPTLVRPLNELQVSGDLINALIRGDVIP
ncbi:MAG: AAA family ATPase [Acidobacteria bacterium]|nr:AAA family ATPase [Acidobacteriota bacterium]